MDFRVKKLMKKKTSISITMKGNKWDDDDNAAIPYKIYICKRRQEHH